MFAHTIIEEEEEGAEGSQRWFCRTRGSTIPTWIPSVLLFSMWIVNVVHMFGGEISKEFAIGDVRDLPHTYSCTCLYSKEKNGNKRDSAGVEYRGVKTLLNQRMFLFGALTFYLFYFVFLFYVVIYFFSHGKLNDG